MALPKVNILKGKKDFDRVFKEGNAVKGNFLFIKSRENKGHVSRFGFIVPVKVIKKAVTRNRLKRILSEVVRHVIKGRDRKSYDMVAVINKKGDERDIKAEFIRLLAEKKL